MSCLYGIGKTIFILALIANTYLFIFSAKKEFETKFKQLPELCSCLHILKPLFQYIDHIRYTFGFIQLMAIFLLGYQSCLIWMINVIVLILQTAILNLPSFYSKNKDDKSEAINNILQSLVLFSGFLLIASQFTCCCKGKQVGPNQERKNQKKKYD